MKIKAQKAPVKKNTEKIVMVVILIILIAIIGAAVIAVSNKTPDQIANVAAAQGISSPTTTSVNNVNTVVYTAEKTENSVIRKSKETPQANTNNMVEISDNYFIQQTNDIYYNVDDYVGKTIKMEGLVYSYNDANTGDVCYAVVRNTPGCCGSDGLAGIDIRYNGDYPKEETWVEVIGVMQTDEVDGDTVPAIQVVSMKEKEKGQDFVTT